MPLKYVRNTVKRLREKKPRSGAAPTPSPSGGRPKPLYGGKNINFTDVEGMADLEPTPRRKQPR